MKLSEPSWLLPKERSYLLSTTAFENEQKPHGGGQWCDVLSEWVDKELWFPLFKQVGKYDLVAIIYFDLLRS